MLYFNDQFALILPLREGTDIFLYNIVTERYSLLRFSAPNTPETTVTDLKAKFINLLSL